MHREQPLESFIKKWSEQFPVLMVTGAIQVGKSSSKNDVRHYRVLDKLNTPIGSGGVICLAEQSLPLTQTTRSIPVDTIEEESRPHSWFTGVVAGEVTGEVQQPTKMIRQSFNKTSQLHNTVNS